MELLEKRILPPIQSHTFLSSRGGSSHQLYRHNIKKEKNVTSVLSFCGCFNPIIQVFLLGISRRGINQNERITSSLKKCFPFALLNWATWWLYPSIRWRSSWTLLMAKPRASAYIELCALLLFLIALLSLVFLFIFQEYLRGECSLKL